MYSRDFDFSLYKALVHICLALRNIFSVRSLPFQKPCSYPNTGQCQSYYGYGKPISSMALRGSMLRDKSKYMGLLIPRCLAALPDSMGGGGGGRLFFLQMYCVPELKFHRMCYGGGFGASPRRSWSFFRGAKKKKTSGRHLTPPNAWQNIWSLCSIAYLFLTPPPSMSTKTFWPPSMYPAPAPGNKWLGPQSL